MSFSDGKILALDVGDVRIGVATSDPMGIIASPHSVIQVKGAEADAQAVADLVVALEVALIVVGIPYNQHGEIGPQAQKVLDFIDVLRTKTSVDIETVDESFTTAQAQSMLIQADVSRKGRKKVIDKIAAAHILRGYLDQEEARRKREGAR